MAIFDQLRSGFSSDTILKLVEEGKVLLAQRPGLAATKKSGSMLAAPDDNHLLTKLISEVDVCASHLSHDSRPWRV
jgi:hypothetical protein